MFTERYNSLTSCLNNGLGYVVWMGMRNGGCVHKCTVKMQ